MNYLLIETVDGKIQATLNETTKIFSKEDTETELADFIEGQQTEIQQIRLVLQKNLTTLHTNVKKIAKKISEWGNIPVTFVDTQTGQEVSDEWQFNYYDLKSGKEEYSIESMLTVGNGFIGLRGTTPEMIISDDYYPATYLASVYNETTSLVEHQEITNEDLVNVPNFQGMSFAINEETFDFEKGCIKEFERQIDLKTGLFTAKMIYETMNGQQILVTTEKVVSMAERNLYSLRYQLTPLNFSGELTVFSEANADVYNYNVARYRSLNQKHLIVDEVIASDNKAKIVAHTSQSNIEIFQESQLRSYPEKNWQAQIADEKIIQHANFEIEKGTTVIVEKMVFAEISTAKKIKKNVKFLSFDDVYAASKKAWEKLWLQSDIQVTGDYMSQKLLRLHTFHLLASASPLSSKEIDASVTARGLHGEAYRGHIFWDELFILPFYILHFPEAAKNLLRYRYQRLGEAKKLAKKSGYQGAMFPWQSGLTGDEQSQEIHLNPVSGKWDEDHSRLQRHVSLAIAYNYWMYYQNTHDQQFIAEFGLEMLLEIAKFWLSIAQKNTDGRYDIVGVMGPDEFHEGYPENSESGLKNNAYTNMMVVWLFEEIASLLENLPAEIGKNIKDKVHFVEDDMEKMADIRQHLNLEVNEAGIIAQFADYFQLKEIDWDYYREKYGNIYRMDRILRAEGESADDYQVAKQADSLMIFYNFSQERIDQILADLGYNLPADYLEKNLDYYLSRTSHGSTLSRVVHAQLAEMIDDQELAWQLYQEALYSDYRDIQGGTTAEGIHAGVMAATLYITLTTFAGLDIRQKQLVLNPKLPKSWQRLHFNFQRDGVNYKITIHANSAEILADQAAEIVFSGKKIQLEKDQVYVVENFAIA